MLSVEYQESISEVLDILDNTDESMVKKIPNKFMSFLKQNKSSTYIPNLEYDKPINEMNLKSKTKTILSIIYMKYWASEKELNEMKNKQRENEKIYQKALEEKYSYDNLFIKNNEGKKEATANIIKYKKENMFVKFLNRIINLFRKNK